MESTTIAAIATPAGVGGIGIIRVSGPQALHIAQTIFRHADPRFRQDLFCPVSHRFYYGHIVGPSSGSAETLPRVFDEVLLVMMKAPRSYTREDILEIHVHSGLAVLRAILDLVLQNGAVPAEPGEFTKRAFLNGRIDLTQAEAVIDIINARTESAHRVAAAHIEGAFKHHIAAIRAKIRTMLAETEAAIDFPEEVGDDIDAGLILGKLQDELLPSLKILMEHYEAGHVLRDGLKVTVAGKPNVGKSSLMNRLLDKERAIVTPLPGTTRDFIEESLTLRGIQIILTDTAGVRPTEDPIEKIGIERSMSRIAAADLILFMTAAGSPVSDEDERIYEMVRNKKIIWVENKSDLAVEGDGVSPEAWRRLPKVSVSALCNQGIDALKEMVEMMALRPSLACESALVPNLRQKHMIEDAAASLEAAVENINQRMPFELINIDMRQAYDILGEIIGVTFQQDILNDIFTRFCIGK